MSPSQSPLALISHQVQGSVIEQRASDGYINATAMCKAAGKKIANYIENASTTEYLAELASDVGIPTSGLMQVIKGGPPQLQGTWVHPDVATHLAMWLSPKFAVMVSKWLREWLSGKATPAQLPYHLERHMLNAHKVPRGYFSVLQEMTNRIVAPLDAQGYQLSEKCMPDITLGKMLCQLLREKINIDTNSLPTYTHAFQDGRQVQAKLYPVKYLGMFSELVADRWLSEKAQAYFEKYDPAALTPLKDVLAIGLVRPNPLPSANSRRFKKQA